MFDIVFCSEIWAKTSDLFEMQNYACVNVSRFARGPVRSKRGHGGVCLFVRDQISNGVSVLETNSDGFIWMKLCKQNFG